MDEFVLPGAPEELWGEDSQLAFRVEDFKDLSDSSGEEIAEIAESERGARPGGTVACARQLAPGESGHPKKLAPVLSALRD